MLSKAQLVVYSDSYVSYDLTCCRGLEFRYILTSVISLLFFLAASITLDFCSLKAILFSFAQFVILFISMLAKFAASRTFSALTAISKSSANVMTLVRFT